MAGPYYTVVQPSSRNMRPARFGILGKGAGRSGVRLKYSCRGLAAHPKNLLAPVWHASCRAAEVYQRVRQAAGARLSHVSGLP